jgi:formylmethanofuran dehydrogenase subunit B
MTQQHLMAETITDVACTICACVCDDLTITVEGDRIVAAERACRLSHDWFLQQNQVQPPIAQIDGRAVDLADALQAATDLLQSAGNPLIYGLSRSSTDGQRAAVALADSLGATIDTTASEGHAPSLLALQQSGESTCSLGEVRHRADLVIFWGANPVSSHPRHLERYSLWPAGTWTPRGRDDRTLVVINSSPCETSALADLFLPIPAGQDFEALWTLRLLLAGQEPASGAATGLPVDQLRDLAQRMRHCRCGVIFFGYGVARQELGHRVVEALLRLVIDLNKFTRFHARRMRMLGDVSGADNVLCWQTGYPFSVNFGRGYPRYGPGEFSAAELLARGETDVGLFLGSDRTDHFPAPALQRLSQIPTILLDRPQAEPFWQPTVQFTTAIYGVHRQGTAYRMDDVPVPLKALLPTHYPSDGDVLRNILRKLETRNLKSER